MARDKGRFVDSAERIRRDGYARQHIAIIESAHRFPHPIASLQDMSFPGEDVMCGVCGLTVARGDAKDEFMVRYLGQGRAKPVQMIDFMIMDWPCAG